MCQECPVSLEKLSFFFIQVKIIQVLVFDNWHPLKGKCLSLTEKHRQNLNQLTIHFEKQIKCGKLNKKDENATNIRVFMVVFLWFKDLSSNYFVHYLRIPNRDGTNHFVDRVRLMYLVIQPLGI